MSVPTYLYTRWYKLLKVDLLYDRQDPSLFLLPVSTNIVSDSLQSKVVPTELLRFRSFYLKSGCDHFYLSILQTQSDLRKPRVTVFR